MMLNRNCFLVLLAILFSLQSYAQKGHRKFWEEGPLAWRDFQVRDSSDQGGSELRYSLGYETVKYKEQDTVFHRIVVMSYVDTEWSWVTDGQQSKQALRYHQLIFDIVELYRRQMQEAVDIAAVSWVAEAELRQLSQLSQDRIEKMRKETNYGESLAILEAWEQNIRIELQNQPVKPRPNLYKRPLGYGLHAGFTTNTFHGDLNTFIRPANGLTFGFDLNYHKTAFFLKGNLAGTRLLEAYPVRQKWEKGHGMGYAHIEATVGYVLVDRTWHKITPHAGLLISEVSRNTRIKEEQGDAIRDATFVLGLNYDFKIRRTVRLVPNTYGIKEGTETNISSRISVARINYAPNLRGYTLNLTISLSITGSMLQLDWE